jgi:multiple sugar transport system substrate-binding protein
MSASSLPTTPLPHRFTRRNALYTAAILAGSMLWNNGCASKASDKLRIWSMWSGDEGKFFLDTLREFEMAHPGIQCENLGAVDDQKSVRAIVAGAPPDLLTLKDPLFLGTLAANDALEPLDSFLSDADLTEADFAPGSLSQCTINGRLYAVPYLIDVAGLLINNKVFRENGLDPQNPPRTTEELEAICKRLTKRGSDGRIERIGLRPPETLAFLTPSGAEYISPDGKTITAASKNTIAAVEAYIRIMEAQGGNEAVESFQAGFQNEQGSFNPFYLGQAAMIYSGQWNSFWISSYSPDTEVTVAPIPAPAARPERQGGMWLGGNLFCIPKGSRNRDKAMQFLLWSQTLKGQKTFANLMKGVPNIVEAQKDPTLRTGAPWKPIYAQFLDLAATPKNVHFPPMPIAGEYQTELINAVDSVRYGHSTASDALAGVESRMQRALDSYTKVRA